MNSTYVPFLSSVSSRFSLERTPSLNSADFVFPSLVDATTKLEDNALTALVPTPFSPTDFLKALVSYLPPVFILDTTSTTFPIGIPLPKSLTDTKSSFITISIIFPSPITNSSTQLSITSLSRT